MKKTKKPTASVLPGLTPGLRMRGGVLYNPVSRQYHAIVHSWDNPAGVGTPQQEWRSEQSFATEAAAMAHYQTIIRPELEKLMRSFQQAAGRVIHRKLV
ncbi:MAG: hypothetical protein HC936_11360 [Leptolyngbyaceae cyanobacterium SU_3_3]|nr:hypothetical protein [Leptolyngbyaceae cyanobacterium SU_3_3]